MAIKQISTGDLREVAVAAQCLDSQWIPNVGAIQPGGDEGVDAAFRASRREFLGSFLTSEQLIIQRAFAYNNPVLGAIYNDPVESRAFIEAVNNEHIVFFFANEKSFDDNVQFKKTDEKQIEALRTLFRDATAACLRFDWKDDDRNKRAVTENLARRFHNYVSNLDSASPELFAKDLGIPPTQIEAFYERLQQVALFAKQRGGWSAKGGNSFVMRTHIYDEFVAKGDDPIYGRPDASKPFADKIRALVDLKYNCNLPDALSRYAITSEGDIDRTVLQDEAIRGSRDLLFDESDQDAIVELLAKGAFDEMNTFSPYHFLSEMDFRDIVEIRKTGIWSDYVDRVKHILPIRNGKEFGSHRIFEDNFRSELSRSHLALMRLACETKIGKELLEETLGWWEIMVTFTGTAAKIISKCVHGLPEIEIPDEVMRLFATGGNSVLIELTFNIRDRLGKSRCVRKYPIFQKHVDDPGRVFERTKEKIEIAKRRGALSLRPLTEQESRAADHQNTMNLPES